MTLPHLVQEFFSIGEVCALTDLDALAALPDSAQVCSCNNVSKGGICSAIEAGCTTVGALKTKTKAGTSCGGCTPLVTQLLNAELKKRGVSVNTSMCEHFPYTRQQLFHLVRIGELKTRQDKRKEAISNLEKALHLITGATGNREFFVHLRPSPPAASPPRPRATRPPAETSR